MTRSCRKRPSTHSQIASAKKTSLSQSSNSPPYTVRHLSQSVPVAYPRKESQHKDSINTEATEYSKSATDDESARQQDAAFDPDITDPQHEKDVAGKGLKVSRQREDVKPMNALICFLPSSLRLKCFP